MDTKLLETFVAVVHTGSISAAARRLGLSQPTVSQQVKSLERTLDTPLFSREGGRVELTAAGRALQGYADTTLSSWRFVVDQVREAAGRDDLVDLSIASFPSANAALLPGALASLVASDASLRVKVLDAEPPASWDLLNTGQVEALVTFSYPGEAPGRGLVELPVLEEEFVLLVPAENPLSRVEEAPLESAADGTWIGGCPKCRQELVTECRARGFTPDILVSTDDPAMTGVLVSRGIGVAMRPLLNALGGLAQGVAVTGIVDGLRRQVSLVVPEHDADKPSILALHGALIASAHDLMKRAPEDLRGRLRVACDQCELGLPISHHAS
ncbi:LysR family transcriptional regulator [Mariniluteicoccus flavus]